MKHVDQVSDGSGEVGAARITSEVLEVMIKVTTLQDHNDEDEGDDDENDHDDDVRMTTMAMMLKVMTMISYNNPIC